MKLFYAIALLLTSSLAGAEFSGEWDQATALAKIKEGNVVVLDVRSPSEYKEGHVPTAINIPHNQIDENIDKLKGLENKDILIYCRSGRRAGMAESVLSEKGFKQLYHLKGDMQGWKAANLTIEK